jgi:hypothetical protein
MAFRLIEDICVDSFAATTTTTTNGGVGMTDTQFPAEDVEIRNRLFWSCFFRDELIALYFGRAPMLQSSHISSTACESVPFLSLLHSPLLYRRKKKKAKRTCANLIIVSMDDTAEIETWLPHGLKHSLELSCHQSPLNLLLHSCVRSL